MRYADLHLHTYHSDGTRSPREVVDRARSLGLQIISISDHDNLAAYFEIKQYADEVGVTLIAGVELSCLFRGVDVHVLAYAFDPSDERIERRLRDFRAGRERRGVAIVSRLLSIGVTVSSDRIQQLAAGGSVGRPHVARALVEAGYCSSVDDAFNRYLGRDCPGYVDKERFAVEEAVALIRSAGGVTSVAHPVLYPDHRSLVPELLDAGVDGIEVFHPEVDAIESERYQHLARFRGKLMTGGSDDHGTVKKAETIGTVRVPETIIAPILERL